MLEVSSIMELRERNNKRAFNICKKYKTIENKIDYNKAKRNHGLTCFSIKSTYAVTNNL